MLADILDADEVTQLLGCTDYTGEWYRPECWGEHFHAGVDLGYSDGGNAHLGSPIRSPRDGLVVAVGIPYLGPYAPCILTDAEGLFLELGHVQAVHVQVGDRVKAGQHIADLGTLGASSGGHLHVEVRRDGPFQGPPWSAVVEDPAYVAGLLRYRPAELVAQLPKLPEERAMKLLMFWDQLHAFWTSGGELHHAWYDLHRGDLGWQTAVRGQGVREGAVDALVVQQGDQQLLHVSAPASAGGMVHAWIVGGQPDWNAQVVG